MATVFTLVSQGSEPLPLTALSLILSGNLLKVPCQLPDTEQQSGSGSDGYGCVRVCVTQSRCQRAGPGPLCLGAWGLCLLIPEPPGHTRPHTLSPC